MIPVHAYRTGLRALRWPLFLLLVACGTAWAAAAPTPPDPDNLRLDRLTQELKGEALALRRTMLDLEEHALFPLRSRTSIYVAVNISGFLLESVAVRVNERKPIEYRYTESEQRALLARGYHRLASVSLPAGQHRLRVEFTGRFYDAPAGAEPLRSVLESVFEKGLSEADILLPISRNARLDRPGLPEVARVQSQKRRGRTAVWLPEPEELDHDAGDFERGGEQDPRYRSAVFLHADGRFFSALLDLLSLLDEAPDPARLPHNFWWLLADCYLSFGLPQQAEDAHVRLAALDADAERLARARLRRADFLYQRGYYPQATDALRRLREVLPPPLLSEWRRRLVAVLLAQGRYNEAVEILTLVRRVPDLPLHMQYNLGVALIHDGKLAQGRHILDQVGRSTPIDLETLSIRDKANVTLGYHFLQSQQGATAKPFFERVRVAGPFSNRALLGMGWAEVAPRGVRQERSLLNENQLPVTGASLSSLGAMLRPGYIDADPASRGRLRGFRQGRTAKEVDEQLRRALVPWLELAARDPMDPAVQEALLAIPFALDGLADHQEAIARYEAAVTSLEQAHERLKRASRSIEQGQMVNTIVRRDPDAETGWMWKLTDLPDSPETFYLQSLLAEHRFQEAIKNYRDLRLLARKLGSWRQRVAEYAEEYLRRDRDEIPADLLVEVAHQGWEPPWGAFPIELRAEAALSAPGVSSMPLDVPNPWWVALRPSGVPANPQGVVERSEQLQRRIDQLRPVLSEAGVQQSRGLHKMALQELTGQRRTVERYLVDARFRLARLYDQSRRERERMPEENEEDGAKDAQR